MFAFANDFAWEVPCASSMALKETMISFNFFQMHSTCSALGVKGSLNAFDGFDERTDFAQMLCSLQCTRREGALYSFDGMDRRLICSLTLVKFSVFAAYFGVKGALYSFNGLVLLPYYKGLGVSGRDYQVYGTISVAPFSMKALIGVISDSVPLFGWSKASYIMVSAVLGSLSYMVLGSALLSAKVAALFFFLVNIELAVVDLLCEGKYAEKMRAKPGMTDSISTQS